MAIVEDSGSAKVARYSGLAYGDGVMPDTPLDEIDDAVRKLLAAELRNEVHLTLRFRECDGDSLFTAFESLRYELTQRICSGLATANLITIVVDHEKATAIEILEGANRGWLMYVHGGFEGLSALFERANQLNLACSGWMMVLMRPLSASM
jgi:hypothetical protein